MVLKPIARQKNAQYGIVYKSRSPQNFIWIIVFDFSRKAIRIVYDDMPHYTISLSSLPVFFVREVTPPSRDIDSITPSQSIFFTKQFRDCPHAI